MSGDERDRLPSTHAGELYRECSQQLTAFAVGLLGDRDLAREVVQMTFGKALEHAGSIPESARKAWLFKVARNEALALRRRQGVARKVHSRLSESAGTSGLGESEEGPDWGLLRREQVELVQQALRALPVEQRTVVEQRIYEGRTFAEIAEQTGLPLGTVLTRMRLALGKLEQALKSTR